MTTQKLDALIKLVDTHANYCDFGDGPNASEARKDLVEAFRTLLEENERLLKANDEWVRLYNPDVLHLNLLRGLPAKLTTDQLLHLLGENPAKQEPTSPTGGFGSSKEAVDALRPLLEECTRLRADNADLEKVLRDYKANYVLTEAAYESIRAAAQAVVDRSERHYGYPPSLYVEAIESLKEALK